MQYGGMQVLSSDPAPYSSSQPQMSGLPNSNTSPYQQPALQEAPDASPQAVAEHAQPETSAESTVELPEARHIRRESAVSMGGAVMSSSRPVEFTAGQPHQLYRSASVGYFANRLHAGTSYQANRRSPDSLRYVLATPRRGQRALLMCAGMSSSPLLRDRHLRLLCCRRLCHRGSACPCPWRERQSLSHSHRRLGSLLRPCLIAHPSLLIAPAFTVAAVQRPVLPCPPSRP